jgi:hypothetical protein
MGEARVWQRRYDFAKKIQTRTGMLTASNIGKSPQEALRGPFQISSHYNSLTVQNIFKTGNYATLLLL